MHIERSQALVVGAGPAGAALSCLLARAGVSVSLLERHPDFDREFRGEGLQPSGLDVLRQMGLGAALEAVPQVRVGASEIYHRDRLILRLPPLEDGLTLMSQPALLRLITDAASANAGFRLHTDALARDLLRDDTGRVVGVICNTPDGPREFHADFVIATDGRASTLRARAGLPLSATPQEFDVLWFKADLPDPADTTARAVMAERSAVIAGPTADGRMQIGWIIPKGSYREVRPAPGQDWLAALLDRLPSDLAVHLRSTHAAHDNPSLLSVICDYADRWTVPGLLLLGDAAHPMSPVGGQGINIALRDAVVAANHLCPLFARGATPSEFDAAARRVQLEREPEVKKIQRMQTAQGKRMFMSAGLPLRIQVVLLSLVGRLGLAKRALASSPLTRGVTTVRLEV